ncbi:hypothetical protein AB837_00504 [bacterium AB1]|nr:hypothetical protein AB837_00504 [bacterium AB1]
MHKNSEEIKKIKDRIFLPSGLKTSVKSFINSNKTEKEDIIKKLIKDFNASFDMIVRELKDMHIYGQLEVTPTEVLLDGICLTSVRSNSDLYYSADYILQDPRIYQYYIGEKEYNDRLLFKQIDNQLNILADILKDPNYNLDTLSSYQLSFHKEMLDCFYQQKEISTQIVKLDIYRRTNEMLKDFKLKSETIPILEKLNLFHRNIDCLHKPVINKYNDYLITTCKTMSKEESYTIRRKCNKELEYIIRVHNQYLELTKQIYMILSYLNKSTGQIFYMEDAKSGYCIFLDLARFDIEQHYAQKTLSILQSSKFKEMKVYKEKKQEHNTHCMLKLYNLVQQMELHSRTEYRCKFVSKEKDADFFTRFITKVKNISDECQIPIYHQELKDKILSEFKDNK